MKKNKRTKRFLRRSISFDCTSKIEFESVDYTSDYQSDEELSINSNKKVNKKSNLLENNQQHELGMFSEDELHDKSKEELISIISELQKHSSTSSLDKHHTSTEYHTSTDDKHRTSTEHHTSTEHQTSTDDKHHTSTDDKHNTSTESKSDNTKSNQKGNTKVSNLVKLFDR